MIVFLTAPNHNLWTQQTNNRNLSHKTIHIVSLTSEKRSELAKISGGLKQLKSEQYTGVRNTK